MAPPARTLTSIHTNVVGFLREFHMVGTAVPLTFAAVEATMPQFDPELVQMMRSVLEDVMTRVPLEITGTTTKAYLAEAILKAAAQGHTSYNELLTAATDQIQVIVSMLT